MAHACARLRRLQRRRLRQQLLQAARRLARPHVRRRARRGAAIMISVVRIIRFACCVPGWRGRKQRAAAA
jgi:hypothetical protein